MPAGGPACPTPQSNPGGCRALPPVAVGTGLLCTPVSPSSVSGRAGGGALQGAGASAPDREGRQPRVGSPRAPGRASLDAQPPPAHPQLWGGGLQRQAAWRRDGEGARRCQWPRPAPGSHTQAVRLGRLCRCTHSGGSDALQAPGLCPARRRSRVNSKRPPCAPPPAPLPLPNATSGCPALCLTTAYPAGPRTHPLLQEGFLHYFNTRRRIWKPQCQSRSSEWGRGRWGWCRRGEGRLPRTSHSEVAAGQRPAVAFPSAQTPVPVRGVQTPSLCRGTLPSCTLR